MHTYTFSGIAAATTGEKKMHKRKMAAIFHKNLEFSNFYANLPPITEGIKIIWDIKFMARRMQKVQKEIGT